jgi:uncharacterized protein (TIGR03905 family)
MEYKTRGTCSTKISFDIVDGKVHNVKFTGGCNGNLKGIGALVDSHTVYPCQGVLRVSIVVACHPVGLGSAAVAVGLTLQGCSDGLIV